MTMLRNQGQVLGEERDGDLVVVEGRTEDDRFMASSVRVVTDPSEGEGDVVSRWGGR